LKLGKIEAAQIKRAKSIADSKLLAEKKLKLEEDRLKRHNTEK
jgi:hypothetical protein